ncbi:MAG: thiamine-monophosphate kinase [Candidatus Omnitrophota bacterium]|jgi:thiamine-monophosphate kinase|nr:MAG: thiamine-monophosphate kinase [Candidatus Omnitrophota bacterium]
MTKNKLISSLGEFGLINSFSSRIKNDSSVLVGPGDDCAVIKWDKAKLLLFSCDMIIEGVDFLARDKPELIGRKALGVSISDIAACSGVPKYAVVSIGLPRKSKLEKAKRIFNGLNSIAREYSINIVGGDLSDSDRLVIDTSILGFVEKRRLVLRSGAKPGDVIFVSGALGALGSGKHFKFIPRVEEARYLTARFDISAMIDISDGLVQDLKHITDRSSVGALVYYSKIPLARGVKDARRALASGEEFELLFSLPKKQAAKLIMERKYKFTPIGEVVDKKKGLKLIGPSGREMDICRFSGYRHF